MKMSDGPARPLRSNPRQGCPGSPQQMSAISTWWRSSGLFDHSEDEFPEMMTTGHRLLDSENLDVLGVGAHCRVYKCEKEDQLRFAYKPIAGPHEFEMTGAAGPCAVEPKGRVLRGVGQDHPEAIVMELAEPFSFQAVAPEKRRGRGVIHGDIKPDNFVRCNDGSLCLCDFDSSVSVEYDQAQQDAWKGLASDRYLCPIRSHPATNDLAPPTELDDRYALAITIWEVYTGQLAFFDSTNAYPDMRKILKEGRTVDVNTVPEEVRESIIPILHDGGAIFYLDMGDGLPRSLKP
ncbi:kinase-like domain-containing protein [Podospora didyma]|uniref:Kinase-like domain-containing protein n=1 Tax=Podospora didyma TaxID=330526 RepID=A0AAE0K9M6_9PEZI|nr:kinase-like domain-containing protein [Podospora didyma]